MTHEEAIRGHKRCYGKCDRCVWKYNGGCSEWPRGGEEEHDG